MSKLTLETFKMNELFEKLSVKKAQKSKLRKEPSEEYCIPVVYAKFGDNGIMYWGKKDEFTTYSNVFSIVYNGAISAGKVYAQERSTGILAESYFIKLKGKEEIPFKATLYIAIAIEHIIYPKYSRENLATWNNKVENEEIRLPVLDGTKDLDFNYMEAYISELEQERIRELDGYLKATGLNNYNLSNDDKRILKKDVLKKDFRMGDLFQKLKSPYKGKGRKQDNVSKIQTAEFSLPLINCKDGNNGVMYYGRPEDFMSHKNALSIIYNGPPTEGQTYFQDEIGLYTDAYIVGLKDGEIPNREVGLYLTTAINKSIHNLEQKKYSRGNKATWENKVENDLITLPVQVDSNKNPILDTECQYHPEGFIPDFDYMEKYIKATEKEIIADVVRYKDSVINTTKSIVSV